MIILTPSMIVCATRSIVRIQYYNLAVTMNLSTEFNEDDSLGKFYFNNIDGFKTNFNESLINIKSLNCVPSLIAFCETNLLYSHKTNLFRRISLFYYL